MAKFIREALDNRPWTIYGDGQQTRDFIFVSDLVEAIVKSVYSDKVAGEIFQIATQKETTILELAHILN